MARRRRSDEDVALGCLVYMLLIIFLMPVAGICFLCIVRLRLKYPEGRFLLAANTITVAELKIKQKSTKAYIGK